MSLGNWEDKDGDEAEPEELPDVYVIKIPAIGWGDGYRIGLGHYRHICAFLPAGKRFSFVFYRSAQAKQGQPCQRTGKKYRTDEV